MEIFKPHSDFKNPELVLECIACSSLPFLIEEFNKFLNGQPWFHTYYNVTRSRLFEPTLMCEKMNALHFLHFKEWPKLMVRVNAYTGLYQGIFKNPNLPNSSKFYRKNVMFAAHDGSATLVLNDKNEFERKEYWA